MTRLMQVIEKKATQTEYNPAIAIEQITIGKRIRRDPTIGIERLAKSIERLGLLNPIQVKEHRDQTGNITYQLLAGERRLEAHKLLGMRTIAAMVRKDAPSSVESVTT